MKLAAKDILDVLRQFNEAGSSDVPRQVERLVVSHPASYNTRATFLFKKTPYLVLIDDTAEDNVAYVEAQLETTNGELLPNPVADIETYALPWHGKDVYVWKKLSTKHRLDVALAERHPEYSRSTWQKLIKHGAVRVNQQVVLQPKFDLAPNDDIDISGVSQPDFSGETLPVLYEDDNVCVVNKPQGILTHTKGALSDEFTVADFFTARTTHASDTNRPGIVHRLDRDTSGVIIGAKNDETARRLKKQFSERTVKKTYLAVLDKTPEPTTGLIDVPIGRNPSAPSTFRPDPKGKSAQTTYRVIGTNAAGEALVVLTPKTGRTHQLRVHMQFIGAPIVGDRVYGTVADRLLLHAWKLETTIPDGDRRVFEAPIPTEFIERFPEVSIA